MLYAIYSFDLYVYGTEHLCMTEMYFLLKKIIKTIFSFHNM